MRWHYPGQMKKKMCIIINQGICSAHKGRRGAGVHPNEAEQLPAPAAHARLAGGSEPGAPRRPWGHDASGWLRRSPAQGNARAGATAALRGAIVRGPAAGAGTTPSSANRSSVQSSVKSTALPPPPRTTHAFFLKTILRALAAAGREGSVTRFSNGRERRKEKKKIRKKKI